MNRIYSINGPVIKIKNGKDFEIMEMVYVGEKKLLGEVISISEDYTVVQVYESTTGLKPGEPVIGNNEPISLNLGPGLIGNIFDGIQRPLTTISKNSGNFITPGSNIFALDEEKKWETKLLIKEGENLSPGDVFGYVQETELIKHKLLVPNGFNGVVKKILKTGLYNNN